MERIKQYIIKSLSKGKAHTRVTRFWPSILSGTNSHPRYSASRYLFEYQFLSLISAFMSRCPGKQFFSSQHGANASAKNMGLWGTERGLTSTKYNRQDS